METTRAQFQEARSIVIANGGAGGVPCQVAVDALDIAIAATPEPKAEAPEPEPEPVHTGRSKR